jgi:hypothetical protein
MREMNGLFIGWLDTSIGIFLRERPDVVASYEYALISAIDSTVDLSDASIDFGNATSLNDREMLGAALLVPAVAVLELAAASKTFTGFDEVWWFNERPTFPKPADAFIVSPLRLDTEPVPHVLHSWMNQTKCQLGLGDGIGMNYVAYDHGVARKLDAPIDKQGSVS